MSSAKKASFQGNWLQDPQFSKWLTTVPNDNNSARCKLCMKTFCLSNMGRRAVSSHKNSNKHRQLEDASVKSIQMQSFFKSSSIAQSPCAENLNPEKEPSNSNNTLSKPLTQTSHTQGTTLDKFKLRDEVTKAEILWCVNNVMQHNSLRNGENSVSLFTKMFPDSEIARDMKLHKDKISYSIVYGLANYFNEHLKEELSISSNFVIGFDESWNKIAEKTQMDLSVRFWDEKTDTVKARYLGSIFLNQAKAADLVEAFKLGIKGLDVAKVLQISMDGPNVNWAFYKLLKSEISLEPDSAKLLEIGSCGLHVVHGAFKTGIKKTGWKIIEFLRAIFNLFKMSPTKRGHFTQITGCRSFPLSFCAVRWIENTRVATRALDLLAPLKKYVESVKDTDKEPSCNSFKVVQSCLTDSLLSAKLAFFVSFAEHLEPFLTEFQTDSPMVPFLYNCLRDMMAQVMNRFVAKEKMLKEDFFLTDVFEKEEGLFKNLMNIKEVDVGYGTRAALRQCHGINEKDVLQFRKCIRTCFQHFVLKMQERSPLKFPLTKALSFLNPEILMDKEKAYKNMSRAFDKLIEANVISPAVADRADREFKEVVSRDIFSSNCKNFSRKEMRLDKFWSEEVGTAENLSQVVKKVLILSHGNAALERGFSVNKEMLAENLKEESLIAQRRVFDAVTDAGGMEDFSSQPIPKKMIHGMRNAYNRFKEAEKQRKENMSEKDRKAAEKRKITHQVKELEAKKAKLLQEAVQKAEDLAAEIEILKKSS